MADILIVVKNYIGRKLMIIKCQCTELCWVAIKTPPWAVNSFSFFGGFLYDVKWCVFIQRIFCAKKHLMTLPCRVFPVTFNARQTPLSSPWLAKAARASRKWNFNTRNILSFLKFILSKLADARTCGKLNFKHKKYKQKFSKFVYICSSLGKMKIYVLTLKLFLLKIMFMKMDDSATAECV